MERAFYECLDKAAQQETLQPKDILQTAADEATTAGLLQVLLVFVGLPSDAGGVRTRAKIRRCLVELFTSRPSYLGVLQKPLLQRAAALIADARHEESIHPVVQLARRLHGGGAFLWPDWSACKTSASQGSCEKLRGCSWNFAKQSCDPAMTRLLRINAQELRQRRQLRPQMPSVKEAAETAPRAVAHRSARRPSHLPAPQLRSRTNPA